MTSTISPSATSCIAFVSSSADAAGLASWMRRLRSLRTTVSVLEVTEPTRRPIGVPEASLSGLAGAEQVAIVGVRGSDREGVSRRLHDLGRRPDRIFLSIDGAVAGADGVVKALVEELKSGKADTELPGGTLFIDEAQELNTAAIAALIDVRHTEFTLHLGFETGAAAITGSRVDIRPLAERRDDIVPLVHDMLASYRSAPRLEESALDALRDADWPGDVEELRIAVHRLARGARGARVTREHILAVLTSGAAAPGVDQTLADIERDHIYRVLESNAWNRTRSARSLGIDVKTLYNKLKRYETSSGSVGA